jgi:hypothetical protein
MRLAVAALACAGAVAGTAGCDARALDTSGPPGDGGVIGGGGGSHGPTTRDVDILFMIDNSSGGSLLQHKLRANFPSFLQPLQAMVGGLPNLHIAVITSDMGAGDGSIAGCSATGGDSGAFHYRDNVIPPATTACPTGLQAGATFISYENGFRNYNGNIEDVFNCIAAVGSSGCGFEQPLAAIARALGADGAPPPAENQGFLRGNAFLMIVVVTDEDDCSVPPGSSLFDTTSNATLDSQLGPLTNFRCNEFGHLCAGAKPPRRAPTGSVGEIVMLQGCVSAESDGALTPVATLAAQIRALKLYPNDQIEIVTLVGPAAPYAVHWQNPAIADTGPWPVISPSCMAADGGLAEPAVRINQWAAAFPSIGFSVCESDFATILGIIGSGLAGSLPPADTLP